METQQTHSPSVSVGQKLKEFYDSHSFGEDGGVRDFYVRIEVLPGFHFYFPNFPSRQKAVTWHDIHHLVTGYSTDLAGESEISAWEIGTGCLHHPLVFLIDTSGVMIGLPFNFVKVFKAFARGRRTKNLYDDKISLATAKEMKIIDMSEELRLTEHPMNSKAGISDFFLFLGFILFGGIYSILLLPTLPFIIVYSIYVEIKLRKGRK